MPPSKSPPRVRPQSRSGPALSAEDHENFLGPPPLIDGEDPGQYRALYDKVSSAVSPSDVIEEILVRDVVDLTWEIQRWRRFKSGVLGIGKQSAIDSLLEPAVDWLERSELVKLYVTADKDAIAEVHEHFKTMNVTQSDVNAGAFVNNLDAMERLDRMTMNAEARRNQALREVDRHREAFARRLQQAVTDIEEADYTEIVASPQNTQAAE